MAEALSLQVFSLALVLQVLHVVLNLEGAVGQLGSANIGRGVVCELKEANLVTVDYVLGVQLAVEVTVEFIVTEYSGCGVLKLEGSLIVYLDSEVSMRNCQYCVVDMASGRVVDRNYHVELGRVSLTSNGTV